MHRYSLGNLVRKIKDKYLLREKYIYTCTIGAGDGEVAKVLVPATKDSLETMYNQYRQEVSTGKYQILQQRLESGSEQCLLVYNQGKICGYCHIAWAEHYNSWSNLKVKLELGQVYFFDDYVFESCRGQGLHKLSIAQRLQIAGQRGQTSALTIIDKSNNPSHRAYTSQGFQQTQIIWHLPLLKKNIFRPL